MNIIASLLFLCFSLCGYSQQENMDKKVDDLLKRMTLSEKIGQLNQYSNF